MKLFSFAVIALFSAPLVKADPIRSMSGCYEVSFEFVETFQRKEGHPIQSAPYKEHGLEWVELDKDTDGEIHLQHVLMTPVGVIKHWRQEWVKAPKEIWTFKGRENFNDAASPLVWEKSAITSEADSWLQRVTQVDDSPRYECVANWVSTGQATFWECQTPAPLPRREFTKRSDYDVLVRRNRHESTPYGWKHEQDNLKVQSLDQTVLAEEKGLDRYVKVDDSRCEVARKWWGENRQVWLFIQDVWTDLRAQKDRLALKPKVKGETLWMKLFVWADQNKTAPLDETKRAEVLGIIESYL